MPENAAQPEASLGTGRRGRSGWGSRPVRLCQGVLVAALAVVGCGPRANVSLQEEVTQLRDELAERNEQLLGQQASLEEMRTQLRVARSISEDDLRRVYYPERLNIDRLTSGDDYDGQPGDDGVTVYLQPIDQHGDVVKIPGDVRIQLYDLAAPPEQNYLGEYTVTVDQIGRLWHGKLWTQHFTIKCPWQKGPPAHPEITVRVVFVDYLTKRVVTAQAVARVKLAPRSAPATQPRSR